MSGPTASVQEKNGFFSRFFYSTTTTSASTSSTSSSTTASHFPSGIASLFDVCYFCTYCHGDGRLAHFSFIFNLGAIHAGPQPLPSVASAPASGAQPFRKPCPLYFIGICLVLLEQQVNQSTSIACSVPVDATNHGKSGDLLPTRRPGDAKKPDEAATSAKDRENSQLHHKLLEQTAPRLVVPGEGSGGPASSPKAISPVKIKKFNTLLSQPVVDIDALKRESWSGIPPSARDITWKLLLGYLPAKQDRRQGILERKRGDYMESIPQYYKKEEEQTPSEQAIWHQIHVDILRTHQDVPLFQQEAVQKVVLVRVLYLWAIRHPASSYVQGINELVIPFFVVFLSTAMGKESVEDLDFGTVPPDVVSMVEADCYWCLSALLDDIQDHYTSDQPGIQRLIFKLKELIRRIDLPLHTHLEKQEVHFTLFAFRWMNCLLMRELSLDLITRMWDTYLSEPDGFSTFHVYVCASFLTMWSDHLRQLEFQDVVLFLHHVPTSEWTTAEVEMLLSKAYMLQTLYKDSQAHLKG